MSQQETVNSKELIRIWMRAYKVFGERMYLQLVIDTIAYIKQ